MRLVFLCLLALFSLHISQAQSSTSTGTTPAPPQDPQAVTTLNQALAASGGASAILGVSDYTANGNITYYSGEQQLQGTVTVQGLITGGDIRIDANLPTGVRSWAVDNGIVSTKTESGTVTSFAQSSNVPSSDAFPYTTPLFPTSLVFPGLPLNTITSSQGFSISYKGTTQTDAHSVQDIQVQRFLSPTVPSIPIPGQAREYFIDASTFQVVMTRDTVPKSSLQDIHYSNYKAVNGVVMPFTIIEVIDGQQIWSIQFSTITFNSGLQPSTFAFQ